MLFDRSIYLLSGRYRHYLTFKLILTYLNPLGNTYSHLPYLFKLWRRYTLILYFNDISYLKLCRRNIKLLTIYKKMPVWWVPAVRWRNNYFARNKEALPCCGRGPSCQPLHVQSTSDGSRSLTTLTTPRREHQGGGRRRGLGRGRRGAGEDAAVDAHAERSTRVHWFGCGVRLPSPQNNRGCG